MMHQFFNHLLTWEEPLQGQFSLRSCSAMQWCHTRFRQFRTLWAFGRSVGRRAAATASKRKRELLPVASQRGRKGGERRAWLKLTFLPPLRSIPSSSSSSSLSYSAPLCGVFCGPCPLPTALYTFCPNSLLADMIGAISFPMLYFQSQAHLFFWPILNLQRWTKRLILGCEWMLWMADWLPMGKLTWWMHSDAKFRKIKHDFLPTL